MFELGRRTGKLPPPPWVVWESLRDSHRRGSRRWLDLLPDETDPQLPDSARPTLVVWSSIWPETPGQVIRFDIASDASWGTALTWTLTSPPKLDDSAVGHRRYRLNRLIWADLRYSYGS